MKIEFIAFIKTAIRDKSFVIKVLLYNKVIIFEEKNTVKLFL
jgi:hypothetical protein